jgi:uncharacterized coiled-coil protein SlyX
MSTAEQLAALEARIADTELRIFQQQKHIENLLARGSETADARSGLAAMLERLAYLEASRAYLAQRQGDDTGEIACAAKSLPASS